jgi:uncharacterized protein involved in exopolysaccharide biosynthesis
MVYAIFGPKWYQADVAMLPAGQRTLSESLGQLGGLTRLAGIDLGDDDGSQEALAVLRSRLFAQEFIEEHGLLTVLFADRWDDVARQWKTSRSRGEPDLQDAVDLFVRKVRAVTEDRNTGLITLTVTSRDPAKSAEWANALVARLNDRMRERALDDAERNIAFLQKEMAEASIASLQQSLGSVLESEMEKLLLARGEREFSFKIIDPARPPKRPATPMSAIMVISMLLGLVLGISSVSAASALRKFRGEAAKLRP